MNTVVSVASLASAVSAASPVAASAALPAVDLDAWTEAEQMARAQLGRAEQMIDILRTRYVTDGWTLDEAAAERVLDFFRRAVADPAGHMERPFFEDGFGDVVRFTMDHGQSLDWLLLGEVGGLICRAAIAFLERKFEAGGGQKSAAT